MKFYYRNLSCGVGLGSGCVEWEWSTHVDNKMLSEDDALGFLDTVGDRGSEQEDVRAPVVYIGHLVSFF